VVGLVGEELTLEFAAHGPEGGDDVNLLCGSKGFVNWGDGSDDEPFPSMSWLDCEGKPGSRIGAIDSYTPDLYVKHTYSKPGIYCVSATTFYSSKVRDKACSFGCTQQGYLHVKIDAKSEASTKGAK
jgi:hypothetical protein